jgi:outer membrane protein
MSRILTILGVINFVGLLAIGGWLFFSGNQHVFYVDSVKLISSYKGMEVARNEYKKKAATWRSNIDTLAAEVQNSIVKYEREMSSMSAKEKKLTEELIRSKHDQLENYQRQLSKQAENEEQQMTRKVLVEINVYLKSYGERNGYTIILAATDYGNIAYANPKFDITDEVLEGLNKEYGK